MDSIEVWNGKKLLIRNIVAPYMDSIAEFGYEGPAEVTHVTLRRDGSAIPFANTMRARCRRFIDESEGEIGYREPWWYALKLAEEAGEALKAYNRFTGLGRKRGSREELMRELGDVIYCAFILAEKLGTDLGESLDKNFRDVMTRGFQDGGGSETPDESWEGPPGHAEGHPA